MISSTAPALRPEFIAGRAIGATLARPGLVVGTGDIQSLADDRCAGCGLALPARSFIDNITGMVWCGGCGDARNASYRPRR